MKAVLILSGGFDSTTLLYKLLDEGKNVTCLSFDYGQKGKRELECAKEVCEDLGIEHHIFDISTILDMLKWSSLIDSDKNNVYQPQDTVVPSRNTILLELATAFAISNDCDEVYYGAIKGDVNDYPDTRPEFLKKINELNKVNNYKYIPVYAPFVDMEKYEVAIEAIRLNVPIDKTWSCYLGGEEPCGECFSCKGRIEAIEKAKEILGGGGVKMYTLKSQHRIYGSHYLKDQGGRCQKLHGHQYEIILTISTEELDYKNMIIDTYELEEIFNNFIGVDHLHLNDFMNTENPTMEFMSKYFYDHLKQLIPNLKSVTVYETPEACVTYEG